MFGNTAEAHSLACVCLCVCACVSEKDSVTVQRHSRSVGKIIISLPFTTIPLSLFPHLPESIYNYCYIELAARRMDL